VVRSVPAGVGGSLPLHTSATTSTQSRVLEDPEGRANFLPMFPLPAFLKNKGILFVSFQPNKLIFKLNKKYMGVLKTVN
jgi:hypothetical protein